MSVSHVGVVLHDCIKFLRKNMSSVAAVALLIGAGAWGIESSRAPAPAPSYHTHDQPVLPMVEQAELAPEPFYGPEEFYGPEPAPALERRPMPRPALASPTTSSPRTTPRGMPNRAKKAKRRVDMPNAFDASTF